MTAYYDILEQLKTLCEADININTVSRGMLSDIDKRKETVYALAHVMTNNVTPQGNALIFNMTLLVMDQVDYSKADPVDRFYENNNEVDVLNTTLASILRVLEQFKRGDVSESGYQLTGDPTLEPFADRFENGVAGWSATFNVTAINGMTICD